MKTIIALEIVIAATMSACGKADAQTRGTTDGGTGYTSRQQVKCNTVTMPDDGTTTQITAACTNVDDLPLSGSCSKPGVDEAVLGVNGPAGWEGPGGPAAWWTCGWVAGGKYVNVHGATATICCVVKQ